MRKIIKEFSEINKFKNNLKSFSFKKPILIDDCPKENELKDKSQTKKLGGVKNRLFNRNRLNVNLGKNRFLRRTRSNQKKSTSELNDSKSMANHNYNLIEDIDSANVNHNYDAIIYDS